MISDFDCAYLMRVGQVREIKNGRLAMIAIGGITHHYFLTGKGPIEFITQVGALPGVRPFLACLRVRRLT